MSSDDRNRNEFPVVIPDWWASRTRPVNQYQALMECMPGQDPAVSSEERMLVRDEVAAAVHVLTEQELWVFNSIVVQGMSMRAVARQLSAPKTSIARIRDRALAKMRDELADNPNVIALLAEMRNA